MKRSEQIAAIEKTMAQVGLLLAGAAMVCLGVLRGAKRPLCFWRQGH